MEADVGTPIVLSVDSELPPVLGAQWTVHWEFSGATLPRGGHEMGIHSARWLPIATEDAFQLTFVPRRGGVETVRAQRGLAFGTTFRPLDEVTFTIRVRCPRPRPPELEPTPVTIEPRIPPRTNKEWPAISAHMTFALGISDTNGATGALAALQLVMADLKYYPPRRTHFRSQMQRCSTDDEYVLDVDEEKEPGVILYAGPQNMSAAAVKTEDHPATWLTSDDRIEDVSAFMMLLLFKSSRHRNACWVPIQCVRWGFAATAEADKNYYGKWYLTQELGPHVVKVVDEPDPDLLSWTRNYRDVKTETIYLD